MCRQKLSGKYLQPGTSHSLDCLTWNYGTWVRVSMVPSYTQMFGRSISHSYKPNTTHISYTVSVDVSKLRGPWLDPGRQIMYNTDFTSVLNVSYIFGNLTIGMHLRLSHSYILMCSHSHYLLMLHSLTQSFTSIMLWRPLQSHIFMFLNSPYHTIMSFFYQPLHFYCHKVSKN